MIGHPMRGLNAKRVVVLAAITLLIVRSVTDVAGGTGRPSAAPSQQISIGFNTEYQTHYFVFDSGMAGPTVLVQAGIHGDEPAGTLALEDLARVLKVTTGRAILFPRMNVPALERKRRFVNIDLNRAFVFEGRMEPFEYRLAKEVFDLVGREKVDYVLTLHESRNLHSPKNGHGLGQTICYGVKLRPKVIDSWLRTLNAGVPTRMERFAAIYFPVAGSSTEVLVERHNLMGGFCVETWMGFDIRRRVTLQRRAVETFFRTVGLAFDTGSIP